MATITLSNGKKIEAVTKMSQVYRCDVYLSNEYFIYGLGDTPENAEKNALEFVKAQLEKEAKRFRGTNIPVSSNDAAIPQGASVSGRGACFVGKTWVGNPLTKEKKRVDASEAETLLANGWIKAGPRTTL